MAFNAFSDVRLGTGDDDGMLLVNGRTDPNKALGEVTAFDAAVIALANPDKRVQGKQDQKLINPWAVRCTNEAPGFGPFAVGEVVLVIGTATHSLEGEDQPYLWHGTFRVQTSADAESGVVKVAPVP